MGHIHASSRRYDFRVVAFQSRFRKSGHRNANDDKRFRAWYHGVQHRRKGQPPIKRHFDEVKNLLVILTTEISIMRIARTTKAKYNTIASTPIGQDSANIV